MFIITDDPLRDFASRDEEQTEWLEKRPVCCHCNHHIQDERMWVIGEDFYHEECAEDEFRRWTEDYIS